MGCHTWYRKPLVKGKENVQAYLRDEIERYRKEKWWDEECEKDVPLRLMSIENMNEADAENEEFLTIDSVIRYVQGEPVIFVKYENDSDEPRIGGYPEVIITSSEQMFEVMNTGLTGWQGKHFHFYWEKDREDIIRNLIIEFFQKYPDGIIEFG
jgi:hypothetical protein